MLFQSLLLLMGYNLANIYYYLIILIILSCIGKILYWVRLDLNNTTTNKNIKNQNIDWTEIQSQMKNKLGSEIYESWLKKINFIEEFNNYILLSVPTRFIRDWITSRYLDQILQIVKLHKREISRIEISIDENFLQNQNIQKNGNSENLNNQKNNVSFILCPSDVLWDLLLGESGTKLFFGPQD